MRKLALITGASGGLGMEFAKLLAADGYDLALVARSAAALDALASQLHVARGVNVESIVQDLSLPDAADAVVARVPRCDVLINNAGFASNGRFDTIEPERVMQELMLDVVTLTALTRKYLPGMIERKDGRVLNVASTAAFLPGPFMAVYYASKAFVLSFSEALWEELRGTGVTVTCLCPGATATGFVDRAEMHDAALFKLPAADPKSVVRAGYSGMVAGKRLVVPGVSNKLVALGAHLTPRRMLLKMSRTLVEQPPKERS